MVTKRTTYQWANSLHLRSLLHAQRYNGVWSLAALLSIRMSASDTFT